MNKANAIAGGRPKVAKTIILAGSCSEATNRQVSLYRNSADALKISKDELIRDKDGYLKEVLDWLTPRLDDPFAPLGVCNRTSRRTCPFEREVSCRCC